MSTGKHGEENKYSEDEWVPISSSNSCKDNRKQCKCTYCGKILANSGCLKQHTSNFHEHVKYRCKFCKKKFTQQSSLVTHISNVHKGKKHKCPTCKQLFTQRSTLVCEINVPARINVPPGEFSRNNIHTPWKT